MGDFSSRIIKILKLVEKKKNSWLLCCNLCDDSFSVADDYFLPLDTENVLHLGENKDQ